MTLLVLIFEKEDRKNFNNYRDILSCPDTTTANKYLTMTG